MEKSLRQTLADRLKEAMAETPGLDTQIGLARRAKVAQSHLSKVLRAEAAATVDMLAALAVALDREPWELLVDDQATREAALRKMLLGRQELPTKTAVHKRRKT